MQNHAKQPKSSLNGGLKTTEDPSLGGHMAPTQPPTTGAGPGAASAVAGGGGDAGGALLAWQVVDVTTVHQQVAVLGVAEWR